ncbi:hypothetical protein FQN60_012921, partial [Etheostoma spectabile]
AELPQADGQDCLGHECKQYQTEITDRGRVLGLQEPAAALRCAWGKTSKKMTGDSHKDLSIHSRGAMGLWSKPGKGQNGRIRIIRMWPADSRPS